MPSKSPVDQLLFRMTDAQLRMLMDACRPLQPRERSAFLAELATAVSANGEIGDGALFRAVKEVQRKHFDAPLATAGDEA